MARGRPFADAGKVEIFGGKRDPFLMPNVTRDLNLPGDRNIVTSMPADYALDIVGIEYKGSRKKGDFFKATFLVLWGNGPNPIGSRAVFMISDRSEYFMRDVTRLVANAMNADPYKFTESDFEAVVSPAQPITRQFRRAVRVQVDNVKGKEPPHKDFTRHDWSPIEVTRDPATGAVTSIAPPTVDNVAAALEAMSKQQAR